MRYEDTMVEEWGSILPTLLTAGAIALVLMVQISFWFPPSLSSQIEANKVEKVSPTDEKSNGRTGSSSESSNNDEHHLTATSPTKPETNEIMTEENLKKDSKEEDDEEEDLFAMNSNWRCACEGGFLPPGFGGVEAVMRMGAGQCYHKKAA